MLLERLELDMELDRVGGPETEGLYSDVAAKGADALRKGSLWHAYRRGWATARKHLPGADVAELGGWGATETMEKVYQQADPGTMIAIVSTRHELREAK